MVTRRTKRLALAAVVVMVLGLAACTHESEEPGAQAEPPPAEVGPRNGGSLVVGLADDTANWSPASAAWSPSQLQVGRTIYDRLAAYADNRELMPELAEAITPNSDFTEWTITLREGVVFHDGSPLEAAALQANLDAQRLSPVVGPILVPIKSVFVTGPRTVRVSMRTSWSTFPHVLTTQAGFVASVATLTTPDGAAKPVGTGPFEFVAATPGRSVDVEKNSSYWRDGLPRLDDVSFRVVPDGEVRVQQLLDRRVDMIMADDPVTIATLRKPADTGRVNLLLDRDEESPKLTFVFNTARPPFIDVVARHAVAIATDRTAMVAAGYDGVLVPAKGPVSDQSLWFIDYAYPPRDVPRAREDTKRYAEIYGEPLTFTLKVPLEPVYLRFAGLWQQQLREAGITMTIAPATEQQVRDDVSIGDYQAAMLPMFGEWHPDLYYPALHRSQMTPVGAPGWNYPRYGSDPIDEALDEARETGELAPQVDSYRVVQEELIGSNAYLFLLRLPEAAAAQPDVRDLTVWETATGRAGLGQEHGTVSLTFAWLDRAPSTGE
jgi:peptide/nickel transport system substrate-binding protein